MRSKGKVFQRMPGKCPRKEWISNPPKGLKKKSKSKKPNWLKEIQKYQTSTDLMIPKSSFERVVRDVAMNIKPDVRFKKESISALQEASEAFLVGLFEDANLIALHSKRVTVQTKDMRLARLLKQ